MVPGNRRSAFTRGLPMTVTDRTKALLRCKARHCDLAQKLARTIRIGGGGQAVESNRYIDQRSCRIGRRARWQVEVDERAKRCRGDVGGPD